MTLTLPEVAEIAHAKGDPLIVDAAAELTPRSNFKRFLGESADIVTCSGGKAIGGPLASGILACRASLITSVAPQHKDVDVPAVTWNKRQLLAEGLDQVVPHQEFGRLITVDCEAVIGLFTALKRYAAGSDK